MIHDLIFFLLPSIFTAANCSPGKCFIIFFVSFKFFLVFSCSIPSALDEAGLSTEVEIKTNDAYNVFPFAVFPQTLLRRFMNSKFGLEKEKSYHLSYFYLQLGLFITRDVITWHADQQNFSNYKLSIFFCFEYKLRVSSRLRDSCRSLNTF